MSDESFGSTKSFNHAAISNVESSLVLCTVCQNLSATLENLATNNYLFESGVNIASPTSYNNDGKHIFTLSSTCKDILQKPNEPLFYQPQIHV